MYLPLHVDLCIFPAETKVQLYEQQVLLPWLLFLQVLSGYDLDSSKGQPEPPGSAPHISEAPLPTGGSIPEPYLAPLPIFCFYLQIWQSILKKKCNLTLAVSPPCDLHL